MIDGISVHVNDSYDDVTGEVRPSSGPVAVVVTASEDDLRRPLNMPPAMYKALSSTYNLSQLAAILSTFRRQSAVAMQLSHPGASVYKRSVVSELCDIALIQV
jgi:hypothetical protein